MKVKSILTPTAQRFTRPSKLTWFGAALALTASACATEVVDTGHEEEPSGPVVLDPESASPWQCSDGEDNDQDGLIDCEDPDCEDSEDCTEWVEDGDCSDGVDNDEDGLTDCDDEDCADAEECAQSSAAEDPEAGECVDGVDNDGDGLFDCDDPDCADTQDCAEDSGCEDDELEIDVLGPLAPSVGDDWMVWLRCDGATLIGTLVLRFDPPDFATTEVNQVTFRRAGTGEMTVQVGGYRASMDVTVSP
jgi:hypothetical protein